MVLGKDLGQLLASYSQVQSHDVASGRDQGWRNVGLHPAALAGAKRRPFLSKVLQQTTKADMGGHREAEMEVLARPAVPRRTIGELGHSFE